MSDISSSGCRNVGTGRRGGLRAAHGAHRAAAAAAGVEQVGAVGLEAADAGAGGIASRSSTAPLVGVDAADLALVAFPGAVPELAVDPGDAGDEAVRLDRAQHLCPSPGRCWWILRSRYWPTQRLPSAQARPESSRGRAPGIEASTSPVRGSILSMRASAICQRCLPSKAVPASAARVERLRRLAGRRVEGDERGAERGPDAACRRG